MNGRVLAVEALVGGASTAAVPLAATAVLLAGMAGAHLLRRTPAAARHLLWVGTLGAVVVLWISHAFVPQDMGAFGVPLGASGDGARAMPATEWWSPTALGAVWATGCVLLIAYRLVGWWRVARLARDAAPVRDARVLRHLARARIRGGVARPVIVRTAPGCLGPAVSGVWRPVLFLPADAATWEDARLDAVLAHELAHVARRDLLVEALAQAAVALYWYHPLAWIVARRERLAREQACDDAVLRSGAAPVAYAATLLAVARAVGRTPGPALGFARVSALETRVAAVLDPARVRRGVSRRGGVGVGLALTFACGLGLVHPAPPSRTPGGLDRGAPAAGGTPTLSATPTPDPLGGRPLAPLRAPLRPLGPLRASLRPLASLGALRPLNAPRPY